MQMARGIQVPSKNGLYPTKGAAKKYFSGLLSKLQGDESLTPEEMAEVFDLHERYCKVSSWPEYERVNVIWEYNNDERESGVHRPTPQLVVVMADSSKVPFSFNKAIDEITAKP